MFRLYKKTILFSAIIILVIISGVLLSNNYNAFNKLTSSEFIDIIKKDEESYLLQEQLDDYETNINRELEIYKDSKSIKRAYYSLGIIKYLENNYDQSINYLEESLKYDDIEDKEMYELDIMTYSALSSNLILKGDIEESEKKFNKAKSIAIEYNMEEKLCELYYGRAKAKLIAGYNVNESIELIKNALKYTRVDEHRIRNYLYLSTLYKLHGEFEEALEYSVEALEIAVDIKDNVLINRSVINLGENYYMQGNYAKTIDIYETFIESGRLKSNINILTIYGYLLESCAREGEYSKYEKYKELYLNIAKDLDPRFKNRELVWLYATCIEFEVDISNLELAKEYLKEAKSLYNENKKDMYANVDLLLEYSEAIINYEENKDYNKSLKEYELILEHTNIRGIESDLNIYAMDDIIKIAYENEDDDTLIKYLKLRGELKKNNVSLVDTDNILSGITNYMNEKEIFKVKVELALLSIVIIVILYTLINIIKKNKAISRLNLKLDEMSKTDSLTKVYNKGYLNEKLKQMCELKEDITFIMIDIDYFKLYNDNYGHLKGDEVLIKVSQIIKSVFIDDLVFRFGGEEFSIISKKKNDELVEDLEKLQKEIFNINIGHKYSQISDRLTLSIGIASSKLSNEAELSKLVKKADENLYKSKQNGRNRYTY